MRNRNRDNDGNVVQWLKLKASPDNMHYKYGYDDALIQCGRGRPNITKPNELLPPSNETPQVSQEKFKDLKYICDSLAIPRAYHVKV